MKRLKIYATFILLTTLTFSFSQDVENPKTGWKISNRTLLRNNQEAIIVVNGNIVHKDILNAIAFSKVFFMPQDSANLGQGIFEAMGQYQQKKIEKKIENRCVLED